MSNQELIESDFEISSKAIGDGALANNSGLSSLKLDHIAKLSTQGDKIGTNTEPTEIVFSDIPGFSNAERTTLSKDHNNLPGAVAVEVLAQRNIGAVTMRESRQVYTRALQEMTQDGHHLHGGGVFSGIGNILQNAGVSKKTWVCAEQAEYLARELKHDPKLHDSRVYLIHTPDWEHLFVGLKTPEGHMIYMDPWEEKPPSLTSPNVIAGMIEYEPAINIHRR